MSYSDEQKQTIRAMQVLGFSFPPDKKRTQNTLKELPFEYLARIKAVYEHEFKFNLTLMDSILDTVCFTVCNLCDREQSSYGDIPDGWGWYDAGVGWYMMCDECHIRYIDKFNKEPVLVRDIENMV